MRIINGKTCIRKLKIKSQQIMGKGHLKGNTENVFIQLKCDNQVVGYGEIALWNVSIEYSAEEIIGCFYNNLLPRIYKHDPFEIDLIENKMKEIKGFNSLKAAVIMAMYDIIGKSVKKPLCELFGNPVRSHIKLSYSISTQDVKKEIEEVKTCFEEGYRIFKIKLGCLSTDEDIERIVKIKEEYPDVILRVDFNQSSQFAKFKKMIPCLIKAGIKYIEQPFKRGKDDLIKWFGGSQFEFVADESCVSEEDLKLICDNKYYKGISLKLAKIGGINRAMQFNGIASKFKIFGYAGGTSETTFGVMAAVHLFCTFNNMIDGSDFYFPFKILAEDFIEPKVKCKNGKLYPLNKHGIGCCPPRSWFE